MLSAGANLAHLGPALRAPCPQRPALLGTSIPAFAGTRGRPSAGRWWRHESTSSEPRAEVGEGAVETIHRHGLSLPLAGPPFLP